MGIFFENDIIQKKKHVFQKIVQKLLTGLMNITRLMDGCKGRFCCWDLQFQLSGDIIDASQDIVVQVSTSKWRPYPKKLKN